MAVEFPNTFLGTEPSTPPPTSGCQHDSGQPFTTERGLAMARGVGGLGKEIGRVWRAWGRL